MMMTQEDTVLMLEGLIQPFEETLMVIDKNGYILFATDYSYQTFQRDKLINESLLNLITEEGDSFRDWLNNLEGNKSAEFRFNIVTGQNVLPMRMHTFSRPTASGEVILLSMKDDSEIHKTRRDILRKTLAIEHFSKSRKIRDGKLDEAIYEVLEMSSKATETKRVSVWMMDKQKTKIDCIGSFDDAVHVPLPQTSLPRIAIPNYFELFNTQKIIISNDSLNCPVTEELRESYLIPNNIHAMMDVPIRIEGDIVGVICFENVGKERVWTLQDQKFGLISAQMISLALETYERKKFQTQLEAALQEQQNLFKESNHRIKNNLAIISSLINLQEQRSHNDYHGNLFRDLGNRVLSIASLHELLNTSQGYEKINFKAYLDEIINKLTNSFSLSHQHIQVKKYIQDVEVPISKAIPLGLIVNEIITNSFKHAFNDAGSIQPGDFQISIEVFKENDTLKMVINDNGSGFDINKIRDTLGLEIMKDLVDQLDGDMEFSSIKGAEFIIKVDF